MNIENLTSLETSVLLKPYIETYFESDLAFDDDNFFSESFLLDFDEVVEQIPVEHHLLLSKEGWFMVDSGFLVIETNSMREGYIVSLISNREHTRAYFLILQPIKKPSEHIVIKDFLSQQ